MEKRCKTDCFCHIDSISALWTSGNMRHLNLMTYYLQQVIIILVILFQILISDSFQDQVHGSIKPNRIFFLLQTLSQSLWKSHLLQFRKVQKLLFLFPISSSNSFGHTRLTKFSLWINNWKYFSDWIDFMLTTLGRLLWKLNKL